MLYSVNKRDEKKRLRAKRRSSLHTVTIESPSFTHSVTHAKKGVPLPVTHEPLYTPNPLSIVQSTLPH